MSDFVLQKQNVALCDSDPDYDHHHHIGHPHQHGLL